MAESQANENTCVVCFKNVLYYSIGECDHPVCFECSTRMRVLCLQNECPICRQDLSRVVFTDTIETYKELRNRVFSDRLFERQFKIAFSNEEIKSAYELLLENRCKLCEKAPPFRHFSMLNDHMRKSHERYFCELCVKHLKIFTSERKTYTRQELAHHRRKGDLDDTSHRGHPLCEFCEERFMDADELYRHLRKEHLYCHLCDADGRNLYYASHSALAHHFRTDHYLCEEGDCAGQHLTAVFRSEIDLKAHKATIHGRNLTRGASRQARTLELQFNITPHPVAQRAPRERERERDRERERERERAEPARAPSPAAVEAARIDTRSDQHFPRLSPATPATNLMLTPSLRGYKGGDGLTRNNKNFPELGGGGASSGRPASAASATTATATATTVAATVLKNSKPSVSIQLHSQPTSASNFRLTQTSGNNRISLPPQQKKQPPLFEDDFPSLSVGKDDYPSIGAATMQQPKVTMINSQEMQSIKNNQSTSRQKKPHLNAEAFPALSSTTTPTAPPQWITVSKPKEKQKSAKPELKKTTPREPVFNPVADFPTLPVNHKTKTKKTQPQPQPQPAIQNEVKLSKKEKKKQNNKKENLLETNYLNGGSDKINKDMYENMSSNPTTEVGKKIKTVEAPAPAPVVAERNRNGGNGDFSLTAKDYPPLNPRSVNTMPMRTVPQYSVPPGFGPRPACDGLLFINSSGQTFSAPVHSYIHPPDFELRNRALVKHFAIALGSTAAVDVFKESSRAFRDNTISAADFYDQCRSTLGTQFDDVFPDLVALLPDIAKQQELVAGRDIKAYLEVCPTCGQLVTPGDRLVHDTAHWPPLAPR